MTIYRAHILYTPTPAAFVSQQGAYIVVDNDGYIQGVYENLPEEWSKHTVVDFGNKILIPAMNDMHVHAPQYANMGIAMDLELIPWLNTYTFPEESKFVDTVYAQTIYDAFVNELCRQGTMRAAVFATTHLPATQCLIQSFEQKGMGAMIGLVGMDRNAPEELLNSTQSWLEGMHSMMQLLDKNPLIKPIITPRFIPSCTPQMLQAMGNLAKDYQLPIQSHLSENKKEIEWVKQLEPQARNYGDAYNRYELFGQTPTLMAHCCYTQGEELKLMRENNVTVVHCPTSNCNLASGIAPVRRFVQEGIDVTLGSDIAGGNHLSMMRVMQYAVQMSKLHYALSDGNLAFLSLSEVFYMATKAGGKFFGRVGSFEPGYAFDALLIDDTTLHPTSNNLQQRLEKFIYLGDDRNIEKRFCQGRLVNLATN